MSSGHRPGISEHRRPSVTELLSTITDPHITPELRKPHRESRAYSIPWLAGYSRDGKTIYYDKHLPEHLQIQGAIVAPSQFLYWHEVLEKALIDHYGWSYARAHAYATVFEHLQVSARGISPAAYEEALRPWTIGTGPNKSLIGIDELPPDLDLYPYVQTAEDDKIAKKVISLYKEQHGLSMRATEYHLTDGPDHCSVCRHYVNSTTCSLVIGTIAPDGWCNQFTRAKAEELAA